MGGEGNKGSNSISSIRKSILRIAEQGFDDISGDLIIVATVKETFSDVADLDTFGTMTCFDNKSKIEVSDVPLNAHINDDGSTGVSGKYTFPKVGSDVYLVRDVDDNHERYICVLFSHIDSVFEMYNTSKSTKLIEVDTPDPDEPYETEETGRASEIKQTPTEIFNEVADEDNSDTATKNHSASEISDSVTDGSNTTTTTTDATSHIIDTGTTTPEPAVLGNKLESLLEDLIDAIDGLGTIVSTTGTAAAQTGTGVVDPPTKATLATIKAQIAAMLLEGVKFG